MGMFESCFTWKRGASWVGCAAVIVLFIGGIFTIFDLSAQCTAAAGIMIVLSFIVGALEAPPVVALCGIGEGVAKRMECIKGIYRAIFYVIISFLPVILCQGASAILSLLLLFSSGFFHFLDWLGPRGSHGARTEQMNQMRSEGLLNNDDDEEEEAFSNSPPKDFMEQVTDKAGKAVAAAAVAHMKQQMAETLNPWASSKASTHPPTVTKSPPPPPKPVQQPISVENNLTNPFAMPRAPPSPDLDNPFLELNGRN